MRIVLIQEKSDPDVPCWQISLRVNLRIQALSSGSLHHLRAFRILCRRWEITHRVFDARG